MSDPDVAFFQQALGHLQKATLLNYKKWRMANPGEAAKWDTYCNAVLNGQQATAPVLKTEYGKFLVNVAQMAAVISTASGYGYTGYGSVAYGR